jgi:hypothetical protein
MRQGDFFVRKQQQLRSPINKAPNSFPKLPMSLLPENEAPLVFTQKSRQQPRKLLIGSGKRVCNKIGHSRSQLWTRHSPSGLHSFASGGRASRRKKAMTFNKISCANAKLILATSPF